MQLILTTREFFKRFQLPAVVTLVEWHRAVREFFVPIDREDSLKEPMSEGWKSVHELHKIGVF